MADSKFVYQVQIDAAQAQAAAKHLRDVFQKEMTQALSGKNGGAGAMTQVAKEQAAAIKQLAAATKQADREASEAAKAAQKEALAVAKAAAKEKANLAKQAAREAAEAAREAAYEEASAAKRAAQEVRAIQEGLTRAYKQEQKEQVAAAKQAARDKAAAERQAARAAEQAQLPRSGRTLGGTLRGIDSVLALGMGGLAGYGAFQAGQALYGAGREGAQQARTLLVLQQTAERMGVSAQALQNAITTSGRGQLTQAGAQQFALQLLSQRWAPGRENIVSDAGLLTDAARLFSQRFATSEGQAMSPDEVMGRLLGYIREGNKELVDQFGANNALIAQRAGVKNENLTAEDRARGLFIWLQEEVERLADVTGTSIEGIQSAESRFTDAMDRIKQSLAGPTAAAATWVADQVALFDAQRGASDLKETRAAVQAINQPTLIDDMSFSRQADLQAAEEFLAVAEKFDDAFAKNADAAQGYEAQLNRLGQAITTQNGLTAEQYTELNALAIKLQLVEQGTDSYSVTMSKVTQAGVEQNTELLAIARAMAAYEEMLVSGQITMPQYITGLQRLAEHLGIVAAAAGYAAGGVNALNAAAKGGANVTMLRGVEDTVLAKGRARDIADTVTGIYRGGRGSVNPLTGEVYAPKSDRGKANTPLDQLMQGVTDYQEAEAAKAGRAFTGAAEKAAKAFEKAAEDTAGAFKSALESIPGLFGTSSVTAQDMADAEAGVYQPKADEYLRQLRDEILNGKDYAGVDLADIAGVAGIDQSLDPKAQLRQIERMWDDSSLFANPAALRFINQDAIKFEQDRSAASAAGKQNIFAMMGLGPDTPLTPAQQAAYAEMTGLDTRDPLGNITQQQRLLRGANGAAMSLTIPGEGAPAAPGAADGETPGYLPQEEEVKAAAQDAKTIFVTEFAKPQTDGGTAKAFMDELLAGLDPSIVAGETAKTLQALGTSIFGAIYTGYSAAAGEAEWAEPVVAGLVDEVLPAVLAAIEEQV